MRRQQPNGTSKTKRLITAKRNRKVRTWKQLNEEDSKCMRKTVIVRLLVLLSRFPRLVTLLPSPYATLRVE